MRFASGDRYEGTFYHGFFYGQGKFVWTDGSYYEVSHTPPKNNTMLILS
jgi:hypothetical protein